jgi:hypothetical protein
MALAMALCTNVIKQTGDAVVIWGHSMLRAEHIRKQNRTAYHESAATMEFCWPIGSFSGLDSPIPLGSSGPCDCFLVRWSMALHLPSPLRGLRVCPVLMGRDMFK